MDKRANHNRNPGIDFLRAFAMFFVIIWHFIGQGGLLEHAAPGSLKYWVLSAIQILTVCCVDLYGLTTGYLMCDRPFRLSRVVKLWTITVFWSVAVSCVLFVTCPETRTFEEAVSMFLPILRGRYWFFTAYFVVMLISPVLNMVIQHLTKGQFRLLLAALFLIFGIIPVGSLGYDVLRISTGHHFSWMIVLYLIGGYIKRFIHRKDSSSQRYLAGYFLLGGIHLLYQLTVTAVGLDSFSRLLLTYPSPLVVGSAIFLFLYFTDAFSRVSGNSILVKLIRFTAPGVYSVYVIHVHPQVYWNTEIIALFRTWDNWNTLKVCITMVGTAAALFTVCICLDAVRQWIFRRFGIERMIDSLSNTIEKKMRTLLGD